MSGPANLVGILVNGRVVRVPAEELISYEDAVRLAFGKSERRTDLSVVYRSPNSSGTLWHGGPKVAPSVLLIISVADTSSA